MWSCQPAGSRHRVRPHLERLEERAVPTGNLLLSIWNGTNGKIKEFTSAGALVRTLTTPSVEAPFDQARGMAVEPNGDIVVFNGTFTPQLSILSASTGTWSNRTLAGWSTANNLTYGGVAVFGNYAYATDMATADPGSPNGIVRFNLADGTAQRYYNSDVIQLTLGLDGKLYALGGVDGLGTKV